jgi:outer membrane protein assembly factor BamB
MNYRESPLPAPLLVFSTFVMALERATGRELWKYSLDDKPTRRFVIDGDRLFVLDGAAIMHCIAIDTGRGIGKVELNLIASGNMLVDEGRVFVAGDMEIVALDREGRILWRQRTDNNQSWSLVGLAVPGGNTSQPDYSTST